MGRQIGVPPHETSHASSGNDTFTSADILTPGKVRADGTAALPAFSFASGTGTGMFYDSGLPSFSLGGVKSFSMAGAGDGTLSNVFESYTYGSTTGPTGAASGFRGFRARGTAASPSAVQSGDMLNHITSRGYATSGFATGSGRICFYAAENFTDSATGTDLTFETGAIGTTGSTVRLIIKNSGSILLNGSGSSLATNASAGFSYIPSCAGTPTGTPTAFTGAAPLILDSTNDLLYFYSNSAWHAAGGGGASMRYIAGGTKALNVGVGSTVVEQFTRLPGESVVLAIYPEFDGNVCWANADASAEATVFLDNASAGGDDCNVVFRNVSGGAKSVRWAVLGHAGS